MPTYYNGKLVTGFLSSLFENSQNEKIRYGFASGIGNRESMEDFHDNQWGTIYDEAGGFFGVFDGHGGTRAAEFVMQNLMNNIMDHPSFVSDTKSAIADGYKNTDSEFLRVEEDNPSGSGSTATTALLFGNRLFVANVGDSRAVICRGGSAIAVTRDHKPDQPDERKRIEDTGGYLLWAGTWRVKGILAVSRAFGDRVLKDCVIADPDIHEVAVDDSLEFLILANDGLWDVISNEEAVELARNYEDPEYAAILLHHEASTRGSGDNITIVIVRFSRSRPERDGRTRCPTPPPEFFRDPETLMGR